MSSLKVQFVTLNQKTCNVRDCPKVACTSPQNATTSARDYFAILSTIQSLPMCVFLMLWAHVCVLKSLLEIFNYHPRLALLLVVRDASARSFITKFFQIFDSRSISAALSPQRFSKELLHSKDTPLLIAASQCDSNTKNLDTALNAIDAGVSWKDFFWPLQSLVTIISDTLPAAAISERSIVLEVSSDNIGAVDMALLSRVSSTVPDYFISFCYYVSQHIDIFQECMCHGQDAALQEDFVQERSAAMFGILTGTRIIFGNNRKPQDQFNYRFMGDESQIFDPNADLPFTMGLEDYDEFTQFDKNHRPIFPGYTFEGGKSVYRGEEVGEGGYVYSEPGMYSNIALLDIASMHPSSIVAEELFGPEYTKRFNEILQARIAIKHKDFDKAKKMLGGALAKYLTDENAAADLAQALKIAINSVYGLTSAGFENPFRDNRNKDNIVAKRGALFMVNLKHAVQSQGFIVAHIKTDSIKIPDATPEIIKFVTEYGKLYGYNFEHEATYDRMCLVNDAVYIARYATVEKCCDLYGKKYIDSAKDICKENKKHPYAWTATGTQFQIPYVFKTLFSKENIEFEDMCETKSVTSSLYLDMNEALPDVSALEAERDKLWKQITDSKRMTEPMPTECERVEELTDEIAKGHDYHFIGKVGQFCPIKPGCGGGILLRETENKKTGEKGYAAATGSKGFRWLESEMVKQLDKQGDIDRGYYNNMVDEAVKSLSVYGDFERFAADEPYVSDNTPPWFGAGEPHEDDTTPFDVR